MFSKIKMDKPLIRVRNSYITQLFDFYSVIVFYKLRKSLPNFELRHSPTLQTVLPIGTELQCIINVIGNSKCK